MNILFTRGSNIFSRAICRVLNEPVSHVAIEYGGLVIHSNFRGLHIEPLAHFLQHSLVRYSIPYHGISVISFHDELARNWKATYDIGAFLWMTTRHLLRPLIQLPKANLWQCTGMFLCTEWVTHVLSGGREDSEITPYQLYRKLSERVT